VEYRWPEWIARCRLQGAGALPALDGLDWSGRLDQAQISTTCLVAYIRMADPELMPPGRYASLESLADRSEALPAFAATQVGAYALPEGNLAR
jgi:hypothetical protein